MSFTDALENALLNHIFTDPAYTPATTLYIGLSTSTPNDAGGNFTEPSGNNYSRLATTAADWSAASAGAKTNSAAFEMPEASGSWGTITHVGLFEASSGGTPILWAALAASRAITTGDVLRIPAGDFDISLD